MNQYGSATSRVATLTVGFAPAISTQPANVIVHPGASPSFSTVVTGTGPLNFQWRLNGTNVPLTIATIAGTSRVGAFSGDGGPATNAALNFPRGMSLDGSGNLFIADSANERVRRIGTNGIITTVVGSGARGFFGDGGPATNAAFSNPVALVLDDLGDLFISDESNERIRRVGTDGVVMTIAGNGTYGFSGDGGPATNATLFNPAGMVLDSSGNLLLADSYNNRIRRVGPDGIITTVVGTGKAGYSGDGGLAASAELSTPSGMVLDGHGNLFIADNGNDRIRKVDARGIITTIAGNGHYGFAGDGGAATNAAIGLIAGDGYCNPLAVDGLGNLYFADDGNNRVRKIDLSGTISTVAGNGTQGFTGDGGPANGAELDRPLSLAFDGAGNIFVADSYNNRIRKVIAQGPVLTLNNVGNGSAGNYQLVITGPFGSVTSSIVSLTVTAPVLRISSGGDNTVVLQSTGPAGLTYTLQVATSLATPIHWHSIQTKVVDPNGNWSFTALYVSSQPALFYRLTVP